MFPYFLSCAISGYIYYFVVPENAFTCSVLGGLVLNTACFNRFIDINCKAFRSSFFYRYYVFVFPFVRLVLFRKSTAFHVVTALFTPLLCGAHEIISNISV